MKAFICLALAVMAATSISEANNAATKSSPGLPPLRASPLSGILILPEPIGQSAEQREDKFVPGSSPWAIAEDYPQNTNSMPTPEQLGQLIRHYTSDNGARLPESAENSYYAINFYLNFCTLLKYLTDVQQLLKLVPAPEPEPEHAPINAVFEMIQQLELSHKNMINKLERVKFYEHTYKTQPDSSMVKQLIFEIMGEVVENQGGIYGGDGILELYKLNNPLDENTKFIIDKLRSIFQSCSIIYVKVIELIRESGAFIDSQNMNMVTTLKIAKNHTTMEKMKISTPILTDQVYAKLIDVESALLREPKPEKSPGDNYLEQIIFENNLATAIKMLEDLQGVLKNCGDKRSHLAPYFAAITLIKQVTYTIEGGIKNISSCQLNAREVVKSENLDNQVNNFNKKRYDTYWNNCGVILRNTMDQLVRIRSALGKSIFHLESYHANKVQHDDNNVYNQLMAYMLLPPRIMIQVKNLIEQSLSLIDH